MSDEKKAGCAVAMAFLLLIPPSAIWSGYVLSRLWAWFIVPQFGLPALSVPFAVGLGLVVTKLSPSPSWKSDNTGDAWAGFSRACYWAFFWPGFLLLIGHVTRFFV